MMLPFLFSLVALAAEIPDGGAAKVLLAKMPQAKVLAVTSCNLGGEGTPSIGALVQREGKTPLTAVILYRKETSWEMVEIPARLSYSKGSDSNFLSDFWTGKKYDGNFTMKCTSPKNDSDVSERANGEFVFSAASKFPEKAKHLCFAASAVYNSWRCYTTDPTKGNLPVESFVQMNAD